MWILELQTNFKRYIWSIISRCVEEMRFTEIYLRSVVRKILQLVAAVVSNNFIDITNPKALFSIVSSSNMNDSKSDLFALHDFCYRMNTKWLKKSVQIVIRWTCGEVYKSYFQLFVC